jgi:hypothetical protein
MPTFAQARITDATTRAEMAKMITVYATKILHKQPDKSKTACTQFTDTTTVNKELQEYIISVCQLGLMGYKSDGQNTQPAFYPNATITRAEVGVILSRMLRGTTYAGTETQRYQNHLQALHTFKIMTNISNPMIVELRGNIFLMLSRISFL